MGKALFIFTIKPVQTFIEQSRKMNDLTAGSALFVELCKSAIESLIDSNKCSNRDVIFPNVNRDDLSKVRSIPNRFLAEIEYDDENKLNELGEEIEHSVKNKFETISNDSIGQAKGKLENFNKIKDLLKEQIDNIFQLYWVIYPYDDKDYLNGYHYIEYLSGAVKGTQKFEQLSQKGGRKCSICGERNALFYKPNDKGKSPAFMNPANSYCKYTDYNMINGEAICGVCFTKRFYNKNQKSYSIPEVALMDTLSKLKSDENGNRLLKEYKNLFGNDFNTELYYEDSLNNDSDKHDFQKNTIDTAKSKSKLKEINIIAKKLGVKFKKYYAIIKLDGDNMGKWLGGEFLSDTSKKDLKTIHKNISKSLMSYAEEMRNMVLKETNGAISIYCGGDDVLAFVNLEHLFDILSTLRNKYPNFKDECDPNYKNDIYANSTASAGVAIAHYETPLRTVLEKARDMEEKAKEELDRDAYAIAVLKRSGEVLETGLKWKYGDLNSIDAVKSLITELRKSNISPMFIKTLRREFKKLIEVNTDDNHHYNDIIELMEIEFKRLLKRSLSDGEKYPEKVEENFFKIIRNIKANAYLNLLDIIDFVVREIKINVN